MIYIHVVRDCAHIVHKQLKGNRKHYHVDGSDRNMLVNMEDTSLYLDSPESYSVSPRGTKIIKATTSDKERTRVSVAFSACTSEKSTVIYGSASITRSRHIPQDSQSVEQVSRESNHGYTTPPKFSVATGR